MLLFLVGRSATREREVEKPDEGYDSTGEVSFSKYNYIICPGQTESIVEKIAFLGEGAKEKQAKGEGLQQKGTTSQRRGEFQFVLDATNKYSNEWDNHYWC